ncbi:MAG: hypothetical protein AAGC72_00675 [Planctomycetota bacterium]
MRKLILIFCVSAIFVLAGCSSRPISKTWHHVKKTYSTTKQVYRTTKAVAELVNPLEYIYVSQQGGAMTQEGEPFVTQDAILAPPLREAD